MLRILSKIVLALFLVLYLGCSTTYKIGKEFNPNNISQIKIGITDQKEIMNFFGEPLRKGIANGSEVYTYSDEYVVIENDGTITRNGNTLIVEFDSGGKVKNYYLNIPGKEAPLFGYLIHRREMEKKFMLSQQ